jgi:hypothetical protein
LNSLLLSTKEQSYAKPKEENVWFSYLVIYEFFYPFFLKFALIAFLCGIRIYCTTIFPGGDHIYVRCNFNTVMVKLTDSFSGVMYLYISSVRRIAQNWSHKIREKRIEVYRLCRICTFHIQGCQVFVETLLDYGVRGSQSITVTSQQIRFHPIEIGRHPISTPAPTSIHPSAVTHTALF